MMKNWEKSAKKNHLERFKKIERYPQKKSEKEKQVEDGVGAFHRIGISWGVT